jgi:ADP-ribosylglycohydrolase
VNLGGDADTTGAVYGQLAGTYYGSSSIPQEWRSAISFSEEIVRMAEALASGPPGTVQPKRRPRKTRGSREG